MCGTLLSGSTAAKFLLVDADWQPNDCDLYTPYSQWNRTLQYFCNLPGYTLEDVIHGSGTNADSNSYSRINEGIDRTARIRGPGINIDLMRSRNESAFYPVCFFWSTVVMNAISADSIISAYPTHVLRRRGICSPTVERNALAAKLKYEQRGFTFHDIRTASCRRWSCPHRRRVLADNGCLKIDFGNTRSDTPHGLCVSWRITDIPCGRLCTITDRASVVWTGSHEELISTFDDVQ